MLLVNATGDVAGFDTSDSVLNIVQEALNRFADLQHRELGVLAKVETSGSSFDP